MKHLADLIIFLVCLAGHAAGQEGIPAAEMSATADSNSASVAAHVPQDLVSSGTATLAPGPHYAAGTFKQWLFGDYYRDVWTMPLEFPIIDLEKSAGGLTPIERGGGTQTATLHFLGADGRFYDLRSVDKTVRGWMPGKYQGTFVERFAQDQISSIIPIGTLIVPPLARAAGILHAIPHLVVVPDSPRLGEFRNEFAGMLALFERKPDEDQSDAPQYGFSRNVVGTAKLFERIREDRDARVDERAYAKARLFDMLIGDWDRHENQWRWAEFGTDRGTRYVPVPMDRDFAFAKFDGLVNRIARCTGKMTLRRLVDFGAEIPDVRGLNWQARELDRRFTTSLTRNDWVAIADSMKRALPDDVIDRAVSMWPEPVFALIGPMTARNLKSRRDLLPTVASRYFDVLADTEDVAGSSALRRDRSQ